MGYAHINNLSKNQDILIFRECYASEKIHGTSSHVSWVSNKLNFYSGGANHQNFVKLFPDDLKEKFITKIGDLSAVVYGEAHGGKLLGMSKTYGDVLRFVAFDVNINDCWLSMPQACDFCKSLGIEFVHYVKIPAELELINKERDADSVQAVRNGMGEGHIREGVVLRPIMEVTKNNGERIVAKHKRKEFSETKTPREVDPEQVIILEKASEVAEEFVTHMRLQHVLQRIAKPWAEPSRKDFSDVIRLMLEDVLREGKGEFVDSREVRRAIGSKTAELFENYLKTDG